MRHETEHKSFAAPEETREFPNGCAEILSVGGAEVAGPEQSEPGDYGQPDRDESVAIAGDHLRPVDGALRISVTEPTRVVLPTPNPPAMRILMLTGTAARSSEPA